MVNDASGSDADDGAIGTQGRSPGGAGSSEGETALVKRATDPRAPGGRVRLRAALALEQSGELREAARMFEQIGEHAQAAALRLEHARTLDDLEHRLGALREGAARNLGDTAQGRELHRALARALISTLEFLPDGMRRRALLFEAAQALEQADEHHDAGSIYERMGLLRRAARAYEQAGSLGPLEVVLSVLERQADAARQRRALSDQVDLALREGQRSWALDLLAELAPPPGGAALVAREADPDSGPRATSEAASATRRIAQIEAARPARRRLGLSVRAGTANAAPRSLTVHGDPTFEIGRAPDADLTLPAATLSRAHARLRLAEVDDAAGLVVEDLGSKVGTFWDGIPVEPGVPEPILEAGELALGMAASVQITPSFEARTAALIDAGDDVLRLFAPDGGPLDLMAAAGHAAAEAGDTPWASIEFGPRFILFLAAPDVRVDLSGEPLGYGARIELLVGDRLVLHRNGATIGAEVIA